MSIPEEAYLLDVVPDVASRTLSEMLKPHTSALGRTPCLTTGDTLTLIALLNFGHSHLRDFGPPKTASGEYRNDGAAPLTV